MGKLRPEKAEHLAPCHTRRDEKGSSERMSYCLKSHSQSGQSWGSTPGLLAPQLPCTLCPLRPHSLWNLLLLLWTFLNCGLGSNTQGPGEWTPWGSWSRCSSSCGRGLSVRSRRCIRFPREELCWGNTHEYRLCQQPDCPPAAMPFRDLQCALYNGHPVLGTQNTYQWVPFYGGAFAGYWNVTLIPEGARYIRAAHRSRNHLGIAGSEGGGAPLAARIPRGGRWQGRGDGQGRFQGARADPSLAALMGGDGRYVLNGNWVVSPAGTYEAAGTRVVYTRATGPEETLRAAGPTSEDLLLQVLLQEPNPGIEFEFWLPRERYGPFQAQAQVLGWSPRQPQPREVEPQPLESPTVIPPRTPIPTPEPCPPCPDTRGRAHRLLHYCGSDFVGAWLGPRLCPAGLSMVPPTVFRAHVLGRIRQAQETRYEVRVQLIYKNRSPLRALEYVWAPSRCPCPPLALHRDYLLAARRLISPDGTQDRLLLPHAGYARLWSPAEDSRVRLAARHCPL
ncbi:PREDICTED: ADAMTS-like protein 5 isoform X7 [Capra hircus]|uniref:ADAMTS-like protein 5 isoform X7 n=1 Tax=Capra hircus TaxID=9925 RepID=UPI000846D79E|nr:PREDICTED: ADAMTS-like protein 5 isoform X7 [Capra hircus]